MNTEKTALGIDIGGTKIYAGLVNKMVKSLPRLQNMLLRTALMRLKNTFRCYQKSRKKPLQLWQ